MKNNIVEFPDRTAIEKEAGAWLIKLDGDNVPSAEELASLREWLERSPVHREQLRSFAEFWGKMNVLTELAVPLGHANGRAKRSFVENLRHAIPQLGQASIVTAVIVIGVATTFWLRPDPFLSSNDFYATAVGQQRSMTLADGSVVLLNTNSQIKVAYDNEYRNVRLLQGEAHFTVEKNAEHPFRVYAGNGRMQALGTAFSVYLKDDTVNVTVTEGKVELACVSRLVTNQLLQQETPLGTVKSSGSNAIVESGFVETLGTIKAGESATIQGVLGTDTVSTINAIEIVEVQEMAKRLSWR